MVNYCFVLVAILYSFSASLPFLVSPKIQYILGPVIGVLTALLWVFISRNVPENHIPYYGLAYDVILTLVFFFVPFFFIQVSFNTNNIIGLALILAGVVFLKI